MELSRGSPHPHRKTDNDIHNVLCQQLARCQNHAGLYVVHWYIAARSNGVHTCTSREQDVNSFVAHGDAQTPRFAFIIERSG